MVRPVLFQDFNLRARSLFSFRNFFMVTTKHIGKTVSDATSMDTTQSCCCVCATHSCFQECNYSAWGLPSPELKSCGVPVRSLPRFRHCLALSRLAITRLVWLLAFCSQNGRVLRTRVAAFLSRHLSMGQANSQPKQWTTPQRHPCGVAHVGGVANVCESSPRDWAISVDSHTQQDVMISLALPHLNTLLCSDGPMVKSGLGNVICPQTLVSFVCVLRLAGRWVHTHQPHTRATHQPTTRFLSNV